MALKFNSSKRPTIGVEIELQMIHPWTLDLAPGAEVLFKEFQGDPRVSSEMHQSMLEVNSVISSSIKECHASLKNKLLEIVAAAEKIGLKVSVAGTHPFQKWSDRLITNHGRYQNLYKKYQWLARRMNVYGTHVHIGVESGDKALKISSALVRYLPHLLALSGNSPFWQGIDTGMKSSRISVMESFPFAGLPPNFSSWSDLIKYYDVMKNSGAIESLKDLYWHIRPNNHFGTVEVRICDAMTDISEIIAVTALIQCLVVWIDDEIDNNKSSWSIEQYWITPENNWIAARDGLDGMIITNTQGHRKKISEEIHEIIDMLLPTAIELDCDNELLYLKTIIERGNGADRQRETYKKTQTQQAVVMQVMEEFYRSLNDSTLSLKKTEKQETVII